MHQSTDYRLCFKMFNIIVEERIQKLKCILLSDSLTAISSLEIIEIVVPNVVVTQDKAIVEDVVKNEYTNADVEDANVANKAFDLISSTLCCPLFMKGCMETECSSSLFFNGKYLKCHTFSI